MTGRNILPTFNLDGFSSLRSAIVSAGVDTSREICLNVEFSESLSRFKDLPSDFDEMFAKSIEVVVLMNRPVYVRYINSEHFNLIKIIPDVGYGVSVLNVDYFAFSGGKIHSFMQQEVYEGSELNLENVFAVWRKFYIPFINSKGSLLSTGKSEKDLGELPVEFSVKNVGSNFGFTFDMNSPLNPELFQIINLKV